MNDSSANRQSNTTVSNPSDEHLMDKAKLNNASPSASTRIHKSLVAGYKSAAETLLGFVLFFAESGPTLLIWLVILLLPPLLLVQRYRRIAAAS